MKKLSTGEPANRRSLDSLSLVVHGASIRWMLLAPAALLMLAGCGGQDEKIRSYSVLKPDVLIAEHGQPPTPPPPTDPMSMMSAAAMPSGPVRLLAAIIPHGSQAWSFKLLGPRDAVEQAHVDAFHELIRSITFSGDAPPNWSTPEGWRREPGDGVRFATLHISDDHENPVDVTVMPVSRVGNEAETILANVNRWRGQVGLTPIEADQITQQTERVTLDGAVATLVDLAGESSGGSQPPFASQAGGATAPAIPDTTDRGSIAPPNLSRSTTAGPLAFDVPQGWRTDAGSSISLAAFKIDDGGQQAAVTITRLAGDGGGLLANVNRWCGQIGLAPLSTDDLPTHSAEINIAGRSATLVHLFASDPAEPNSALYSGAVVSSGGGDIFRQAARAGRIGPTRRAYFS